MKKLTVLFLAIFIGVISVLVTFVQDQVLAEGNEDFVRGEILVKFKETATVDEIVAVHGKYGGRVKKTIPGIGIQVVSVDEQRIGEIISSYAKNAQVEHVEPNYIAYALVDDTAFNRQWGLNNTGQQVCNTAGDICTQGTEDADIDASEAWGITMGSPEVKVAILDSGIDQDHEDLVGKIIDEFNFTDSPTVDDLYGHGTHVAGIVAVNTNNNIGVAGVGYQSGLMNGKVLADNGYGSYSWIIEGIIWATDNVADVINMSLGGPRKSSLLEEAVNYAWERDVVVVAAAGNSANSSKTYPAYYSNCIAVAATDNNDVKASFSSYGGWVDVAAPGENIYSTRPNHSYYQETLYNRSQNYDFGSGTSMSTPHVAGVAALVWSTEYGTNAQSVRDRIEQTADPVVGTGNYWEWGRVNACNAVGGNCSGEISPDPEPDACSVCFKGVCDGKCNLAKDGAGCPDCL